MNKLRRKEIYAIIKRLSFLKESLEKGAEIDLSSMLTDIIEDIELVLFEEEDYRDNIPENMQGGYKYDMAEEACNNLEEAKDTLEYVQEGDEVESIITSIDEAIDYLDNASC